jgi:hypothetical protein
MAESRPTHESKPPSVGDGHLGHKKPYTKPAFRVEKVFETTALACGKMRATQAQCRMNRKVS